MGKMPSFYRQSQNKPLATFSFNDILQGVGVLQVYGYHHQEDTTESYGMNTIKMFPNNQSTGANTDGTSFSKRLDLDFDMVLGDSRRLKGTTRVNITIGTFATGSAGTSGDCYAIVKIRKWDGSTETEIANAQTEQVTYPVQTELFETKMIEIDTTTTTSFAKGDTLRVTVELWGRRAGASEREISIMHNPKDSDLPTGAKSSMLEIQLPFELDI